MFINGRNSLSHMWHMLHLSQHIYSIYIYAYIYVYVYIYIHTWETLYACSNTVYNSIALKYLGVDMVVDHLLLTSDVGPYATI